MTSICSNVLSYFPTPEMQFIRKCILRSKEMTENVACVSLQVLSTSPLNTVFNTEPMMGSLIIWPDSEE